MTIFKIANIEIDEGLTALVQVGQWDHDGDRDRGLRPHSQRALWVKLNSLGNENYSLIEGLVAGGDWFGSKAGADYILADGGGIVERQPQPSPHHIFNYTTRQWEDPRTTETEWAVVRSKRARLLLSCDWTQLPDVPPTTQGAWASYRQALRDITQQADPFNIVWPAAPGTL